MAFTHALATNKYGESKLIVATDAAYGTHTTLAGAMADAVSGDTIFLRDSVTENVTLTAGVNITAWSGGTLNVPSITGTLTMTAAGTCTISGLRLVTNGASCISVTGSAASILNVNNCYLSMGSDGITFSSSSSSAKITLFNCLGDLTTTAIKVFAHSSAGRLLFMQSNIQNTGASTTASTISAGTVELSWSILLSPITTSGSTCSYAASYSQINCNVINTTALTHGCTNAAASFSQFGIYSSGTASAISISASCTFNSYKDLIGCSNTNAVTGAGTLSYGDMTFFGSSTTINTTTQTGLYTNLGSHFSKTQPAFHYNLQSNATNVTGDNTVYALGSGGVALTKVFDQDSNMTTTGTFTAPKTGLYYLGMSAVLTSLGAGHTLVNYKIITTSTTFVVYDVSGATVRDSNNFISSSNGVFCSMTAGNTATFNVQVNNSTKTVGVLGVAGSTYVYGWLIA